MSEIAARLHQRLVTALGDAVHSFSDPTKKPLLIDLCPPHPRMLRVYMYSLVGGEGEKKRHEYKVVLRTPGQAVGSYGSFEHSERRLTLVLGYEETLDVFVLWDATLHPRFKNGGNLQVRDSCVQLAAVLGEQRQNRRLSSGVNELVIACKSNYLLSAVNARVLTTGGT